MKGYLLKNEAGDVWQWDMWQAGMALVDFTNPDACKWYQTKLKQLLDDGVDCFKTDFGERIPTDVVYFDGSCPERMHNYYTHLYNKTVFDLLLKECGEREAVVFARSATAGGQQFLFIGRRLHCKLSIDGIPSRWSFMHVGFAFWSHDIGGFENSNPDCIKMDSFWASFDTLDSTEHPMCSLPSMMNHHKF